MFSESARRMLEQIEAADMKAAFATKESLDGLYQAALEGARHPFELPAFVQERAHVGRRTAADGTECFTLAPKAGPSNSLQVLYYHGGGFVMQIGEPHWSFALMLLERLGCTVTVPLYPLVPTCTYHEVFASGAASYELVVDAAEGGLVVMGDSAGGTLALAAGQQALIDGTRQPDLIVTLSPLTDVNSELPGKDELGVHDPIIAPYGMRQIAKDWLSDGEESTGDFPPCILNGPFEGLAPVLDFVGSKETLLPDSLELARRIALVGGSIELIVKDGMWHTYPLMPQTDEAQEAVERIVTAVKACA